MGPPSWRQGVILALMIVSWPLMGIAGKITCPVCGEAFEESVTECPNDGTDLSLSGVPVEDDGVDDPAENVEPQGTDAEESPASPDESSTSIKFKRQDQGGERRPVERSEPSGFSDRMSRIPGDSRYPAGDRPSNPAAGRSKSREEKVNDEAIITAFERRRQRIFEQRSAAELMAEGDERRRQSARTGRRDSLGAPLTSLGFRAFWLPEGEDSGPVGGAEIEVNLVRYRLRAGVSAFLGVRDLASRNELLFLGNVAAGIQSPRRFSPYIVVRGGGGMLKTERYRTDQVYLVTSLGGEVGVDAWISSWLALTPSVGYMRCTVDDAYWHTFTGKISIGF